MRKFCSADYDSISRMNAAKMSSGTKILIKSSDERRKQILEWISALPRLLDLIRSHGKLFLCSYFHRFGVVE